MNKQQMKKLIVSGALMASASVFSMPALSQQVSGTCGSPGGGNTMSMGQMPMMGGGHMEMTGGMTGGGHMGMMGGMMGGGHIGMMGGDHMGIMNNFRELGLTEEQEQQIHDIQHALHKKHWAVMGEMIDVKAELRKAHSGDRPDPKVVGAVYGKMFDLRRQMIEANLEASNSARDVLTEEQIARMKQMKKERRKLMHDRGGMMQGQGGMMQGQGGMMQGQGGMMQGQGGMMQGQGGMMQGQGGMMQGQGSQAN